MTLNPLAWLEDIVSWILIQFHTLFGAMFGPESGWAWVLSIVGLVVVIRIALIPLFVRQIKSQRNLQILQPKIKEIQKKYAGDRERQSQEMMALYKDTGTNPLASCLPILAQAPIFFALFRVLNYGVAQGTAYGVMTTEQALQAKASSILGVPIYATFTGADLTPFPTSTRILTAILIVLMTATTFLTQRQLIVKNTARDNPIAQQQKILLYVFPFFFMVTGINFPVGVLVYWLTTNLWSMGQQFYVIRNNPQPGTPAYTAWEERERKKRMRQNDGVDPEEVVPVIAPPVQREQPKNLPRAKRKKSGPTQSGSPSTNGSTPDTSDPEPQT